MTEYGGKLNMLIGELFDRDPRRPIEPVVKVDQHDPNVIRVELEEYVATDEIKQYLYDIVDRFIESRSEIPESVCCWISGFFGSGKSHFLKILGYILSNRTIEFENGNKIGAATFFCKKHSIPGALILERELKTKAIFVNMLNYDREKGPSITRIVYEALLKEIGLSEVGWISEIERSLQESGNWEKFIEFVEKTENKPWQEVRKMQIRARPVLAKGLMTIDPETYPTLEMATKSIDDVQRSFTLDQTRLVERLFEVVKSLDDTNGRVILLLDEVGLYIGTNTDRLTDLNALAEQITKIGKGKLWLFVTAQEALEEVIPRVEAVADQFQKIRDRFRIKVNLSPENIDTVVKKRLFQKDADPTKLDALKGLYKKHSGSLALAALIKNPVRDYKNLFTRLEEQNFIESYPLMPYHIRLMQEIFGILRSRGGAPQTLTGRERAVLLVAKSTLTGVKGKKGLIDLPIGELVTLDNVYDAIDEELKVVRSSHQATIEHDIAQLGKRGNLSIDSVAKALFLLQHVTWIPCTLENIAAMLYPRLGADKNELENDVSKCLKILQDGTWITEEDGKFRFLTEFERTFEQDVESQTTIEPEKRELTAKILKQILKNLKSYNYRNVRPFNVYVTGDDEKISTKGYIKLCFYSPYRVTKDKELLDVLRAKSLANQDTIYLTCKTEDRFEEGIDRAKRLEKALKEWELKTLSIEEQKMLNKHKSNLERLTNDDMPRLLSRTASEGLIIYQGEEKVLSGNKNLQEIFNAEMKDLVEEMFTEFHFAAYVVEKDEHIGSILGWQGGKLPDIYHSLQLIDDQGNILVDRPVPSRVLEVIKKRENEKPENQTGASIATHFEKTPYGWDPRIIRMTLAALFKNNSIAINLEGKEYLSPSETGSHRALTNVRVFNKARFLPGIEVTFEQRKLASRLVSSIFGERGGNTNEEIDGALCSAINSRIDDCKRLYTIAKERSLPQKVGLKDLIKVMNEIVKNDNQSKRILEFIKEEHQSVLKTQVPAFTKLLKFETEGNLDNYSYIRDFALNVGPMLVQISKDEQIERNVQKLTHSIKALDFIDRWPEIISLYQGLLGKYNSLYSSMHASRNQDVENSIKSLKKHPIVSNLSEEEIKSNFESLRALSCSIERTKLSEDKFVCDRCNATLNDLSHHLEIIEGRKREILTKLDELYRLKQARTGDDPVGFIETVKSTKQISNVISKVKNVSEKAIAQGKTVKVQVEVE